MDLSKMVGRDMGREAALRDTGDHVAHTKERA